MKHKGTSRSFAGAFTIIEVVIVLAIAALIIVIVLLGVAGLQRSTTNKSSQSVAAQVISAMTAYASDNLGTYWIGADNAAMPGNYLANVKDGYGGIPTYYHAVAVSGTPANPPNTFANTTTVFASGATCGGTAAGAYIPASSPYQVAVSYWSATAGAPVCIHN